MKKIILSQSLEILAQCLSAALNDRISKFQKAWIFVPSSSLKQWLMQHIAKYSSSRVFAGCKIATLEEVLHLECSQIPTSLEMRTLIYDLLKGCKQDQVKEFLDCDERRVFELTEQLSSLFSSYGESDLLSILENFEVENSWQVDLLKKLFVEGPYRLPVQIPEALKKFCENQNVYFFGFGYFSDAYILHLKEISSATFFLFSPCLHFWEDSLSGKEQIRFLQKAMVKNISLNQVENATHIFSESPPLLANLGKRGRIFFEKFDDENFDFEFAFAPVFQKTLLQLLQKEIVSFCRQDVSKIQNDNSIKIIKTGSSKFQHIQALHDEIIKLCVNESLLYSDILVLAPKIESYRGAIEYFFGSSNIPFRFSHIAIECQCSFYLGVLRLLEISKTPWNALTLVSLFETPAFYKKLKLDEVDLSKCIEWIEKIFQKSLDWKDGLKALFSDGIFLFPNLKFEDLDLHKFSSQLYSLPLSDFKLFEKFVAVLQTLETHISFPKGQKFSLEEWAKKWESIVAEFLEVGSDSLEFQAYISFQNSLKNLRSSHAKLPSLEVPLEIIEPTLTQAIHSSVFGNQLHAVTFANIQHGALLPSKAILLLGMDEESFPQKIQKSSLDLRKGYPLGSDEDRYAFLQALLSAQKFLRIFYSHIHPDDGKEVSPSLVVVELISAVADAAIVEVFKDSNVEEEPKTYFSFSFEEKLPSFERRKISLSDLVSFTKNPWKFYLKNLQIYLNDNKDLSFSSIGSMIVRSSLSWPIENLLSIKKQSFPKIVDEAFCLDTYEKQRNLKKILKEEGKKLQPIHLLQTVFQKSLSSEGILKAPSIKLAFEEGFEVEIVGEISHALCDAYLHLGDDSLPSLLRVWPEVLSSAITLDSPQVFFAKTGKIKSIKDPELSLKKLILYFLRCEKTLSPLISEFSDALLRKKGKELDFSVSMDDCVFSWISMRLKTTTSDEVLSNWKWLEETFSELIDLYPVRGLREEV